MVIANPIYDVVFKRLMQNNRIARFLIETLTDESLEILDLKPQEFVYSTGLGVLAVMRYDFIATIKTKEGEHKKVIIEIQKANNATDLIRFRNYLAEQYKKEEEIETGYGKYRQALPIIAIYLLGFNLPGLDAAAIKVARIYTDLLTHKTINQKNDFIERLSHDCYVVQVSKIHTKVQTSLEELLSVFEQNNFLDDNGTIKDFKYEIKNEVVKNMVEILHFVGTDPAEKKEIAIEQEAWRTIDALAGEKIKEMAFELELKEINLREERKAKEEKERLLQIEKKTNEEKERLLEIEKKAKVALEVQIAELKRQLGLN